MRSLLLLLLLTASALAEPKILPIDESAKDKSFAEFKKKLTAAVEKQDAKFVRSILASDALPSFGEDRGVDGFGPDLRH